ncbi:MAG: phosphate ABC transporter substrate-binding protein [Cyanobacteriota bacterium]|jgi:phosphate transport system substrate-binding protein
MSQGKETAILISALAITSALVAGGGWFLTRQLSGNGSPQGATPQTLPPPPSPASAMAFAKPEQVPAGTVVRIDGSTSMVNINEALKKAFTAAFPGAQVQTQANGSDKGILALLTGQIELTASSRPLNPQEQAQGLTAVPVARDQIAIVVGLDNPFQGNLSVQQVRDIFQGKITNWSQVGGPAAPIQVINRPPISGTYQMFQSLVLEGAAFGQGPNFTNLERDATTPLLRALGKQGIGYATYIQTAQQKTVRVLPIDNTRPGDPTYPLQRELFYIYKAPPTEPAKAFLGFTISPEGQAALSRIQ